MLNLNQKTKYSLSEAAKLLPVEVSQSLFDQIVKSHRPGATEVSGFALEQLIVLAKAYSTLEQVSPRLAARMILKSSRATKPASQEFYDEHDFPDGAASMRMDSKKRLRAVEEFIFVGQSGSSEEELYQEDWADDLLNCWDERGISDHCLHELAKIENAFLQLPDSRWYISRHRESITPIADMEGLRCICELIANGRIGTSSSTALSERERSANFNAALALAGLKPNEVVGPYEQDKAEQDKIAKQMERAIRKIASQNTSLGRFFKGAIANDQLGAWSFRNSNADVWVTTMPEFPADASLVRTSTGWVLETYWSEPVEIDNERVGIGHIARLFQWAGIPIPCALLTDTMLCDALGSRPPYEKLFTKVYRRDYAWDFAEEGQGWLRGIERGGHYQSTHAITEESPLVDYIGKQYVELSPRGLRRVLYQMQKACASAQLGGGVPPQLKFLTQRMEQGIKYVERYEGLAASIEPLSQAHRSAVQKSITAAVDYIANKYDEELGAYLRSSIRTGKLCRYTGDLTWGIKGLGAFPDLLNLACDHIQLKLKRLEKISTGR